MSNIDNEIKKSNLKKVLKSEERSFEELRLLHDKAIQKFASNKKVPLVGIFWYHNKKVLGDYFDFISAELFGNILGPSSDHCEYWKTIQAENPDLCFEEYEYTPRGRVLYDLVEEAFVVISSIAIIANKSALKAICLHCNIPDECLLIVKSDQHYENPNYLDWEV